MARQRYSAKQWQRWIAQQRRSGQDVGAFCQQRGLAISTFYAWKQRLARGNAGASSRKRQRTNLRTAASNFVEVTARPDDTQSADGSTSRQVASVPLELVLPNGIIVRVGLDVDPQRLRYLLEAIS